ncbi:MAG: hypothetical protein EOP85_04665 [Verrucomicrobiaceae bacterium]|nr:MAG: hypothetical protein EOP85_04665 [Verrucomicrobiaceae bacterium]
MINGDINGNFVDAENAASVVGRVNFEPGSSGNIVRFEPGSSFSGKINVKGTNNRIEFGPHSRIRGSLRISGDKRRLSFGDYTTAEEIYLVALRADVIIGKWCMFSRKIEIRSSDAHSVVERATGLAINEKEPVYIGDHVWVCAGAHINKGSRIPSDSIVAAMSFVNRAFEEEGVILAGIPAKVVKRGITWNRKARKSFTQDQLDYRRYNATGEIIVPVPDRENV